MKLFTTRQEDNQEFYQSTIQAGLAYGIPVSLPFLFEFQK